MIGLEVKLNLCPFKYEDITGFFGRYKGGGVKKELKINENSFLCKLN